MANRPKIVYYVAISLDGYIAGANEDVSLFTGGGDGVEKYLSDLKTFQTVIMGKNTYVHGYDFGVVPGQPAYPHMQHYIFSRSLKFDNQHPQVHVEVPSIDRVREIRDSSPTDVYLCGGGMFAGWLLDNSLIDQLKVKINPIVLGTGIPLFGESTYCGTFEVVESKLYDNILQIITYNILY